MRNKLFLMNKQQGAALVTALVFMSILTMLGISAMRSNTLDVKIHNAMMDRANAFQCAEAALRAGELYIAGANQRLEIPWAGGVPSEGSQAWGKNSVALNNLVNEADSWWKANGWSIVGLSDSVLTQSDAKVGCANEAVFFVQSLGGTGNGSGDLSFRVQAESQMDVYRVTSRSEGTTGNTAIILQSTYTRQF